MRVVVFSNGPWSSFRVSKHFLSLALAASGHQVLYVDPPVSPLSLIRRRGALAQLRSPVDEAPATGLAIWRPRVLPPQDSSVVAAVNGRRLCRGVASRLAAPDLVLGFALESRDVFSRVRGLRVYYCTDSYEDVPGRGRRFRAWEDRMVASADLVVACSKPLAAQLRDRGTEVVYIPHGCDDAAFCERPDPLPEELRDLARPLVGYVGNINSRIDAALLGAARRAAGEGTLVLIGGRFGLDPPPGVASVLSSEAVAVIPEQPPARLPQFVASLDVGVVPYTSWAFNRKSFPIKVLQYLAAGVPVVSSPNGATDELGAAVRVADDPASFETAVVQAIGEDQPGMRERRRAVAAGRPWSTVAEELLTAAGLIR